MTRRNLSLLLFALGFSLLCWSRAEKNPYARYLSDSFTAIDDGALERVPPKELYDAAATGMRRVPTAENGRRPSAQLFDAALGGMVRELHKRGDVHSQFFPAEQAEPFITEMRQEFGGIGVHFRWLGDPPQLTVMVPPEPGSPAFDAGIRRGDRIVAIDGRPVSDIVAQDLNRASSLLRGAPGTTVRVLIERYGEKKPLPMSLVRQIIVVPSVLGDRRRADGAWDFFLPDAPSIAYVRLSSFGDKTIAELATTLARLTKEGMKGLILDLRGNPGGVLDGAVGVCDLFLKEGAPIVDIRDRSGNVQESFSASGYGTFTQLPLVVLVNGDSASASEIVAACLQDDGRAIVIGERTYGKGTVQHAILVEPGRERKTWLKLTSASYWRPSGKNIHRTSDAPANGDWGVSPNEGYEIALDDDAEAALFKARAERDVDPNASGTLDDAALRRAVEYLKNQR